MSILNFLPSRRKIFMIEKCASLGLTKLWGPGPCVLGSLPAPALVPSEAPPNRPPSNSAAPQYTPNPLPACATSSSSGGKSSVKKKKLMEEQSGWNGMSCDQHQWKSLCQIIQLGRLWNWFGDRCSSVLQSVPSAGLADPQAHVWHYFQTIEQRKFLRWRGQCTMCSAVVCNSGQWVVCRRTWENHKHVILLRSALCDW